MTYYEQHREEMLAYAKAWAKRNPEKIAVYKVTFGVAHPGYSAEKSAAYRAANLEHERERQRVAQRVRRAKRDPVILRGRKKWHGSPAGRASQIVANHRRRARKAGNGGSFSVADWIVLCWASAWRCAYCGIVLDESTVVREHRVPLARHGTNDISNIALSCASCNTRKGVKTDVEFLAEKKFLTQLLECETLPV